MNLHEIMSKQGKAPVQAKQGFKVEMIHYSMLHPSKNNFYKTEEIEELADALLISGGILQNLVVRKTGISEYEIISGHKRCLAAALNRERDYQGFDMLPCKIEEDVADVISEIKLILTNSTQRERSDYEKMQEVIRLKELIPKAAGEEKIKARVMNRLIAENIGISETRVKNYQSIERNLLPEAKEKFAAGEIGISAAVELAGMSQEEQVKAVEQKASYKEIKESKMEKQDAQTELTPEQLNITPENIVSECDTKNPEAPVNTNTSADFDPEENTPQGQEDTGQRKAEEDQMEPIKYCPFCGGAAEFIQHFNPDNYYSIQCIVCGCRTEGNKVSRYKNTAEENKLANLKIWNRRFKFV